MLQIIAIGESSVGACEQSFQADLPVENGVELSTKDILLRMALILGEVTVGSYLEDMRRYKSIVSLR